MKLNKLIFYILISFLVIGVTGCPQVGEPTESDMTSSMGSNIDGFDSDDDKGINPFVISQFRVGDYKTFSVELNWNISKVVYKLGISRKGPEDAEFVVLTDNLSNFCDSYVDNSVVPGTEYLYKISTYDIKGTKLFELETPVKVKTLVSPGVPTAKGSSEPPSVAVSWNWQKSWDSPQVFKLYKSVSKFTFSDENIQVLDPSSNNSLEISDKGDFVSYSYTDVDVLPCGKKFYYKISAVINGVESPCTPVVQGYSIDASAPDAPQNIIATKGLYGSSIKVTWDSLEQQDKLAAVKYYVFRKLPTEQTFSYLDFIDDSGSSEIETVEYIDEISVEGNVQYMIAGVAEKNSELLEGEQSEPVTGFIAESPDDFRATYLGYSDKIRLQWSSLTDEEGQPLAAVSAYKVFRGSAAVMSDAQEITEIAAPAKAGVMEYFDDSAAANTEFFYTVKSVTKAAADNISKGCSAVKGKAGSYSAPTLSVSRGAGDSIVISCTSTNVDYKYFEVYRRYQYYKPVYAKKDKYAGELSDLKPDNYEQMLKYKVNPNRIYHPSGDNQFELIASNVTSTSYEDNCVVNQVCGQTKIRGEVEYKIKIYNHDDSPKASPISSVSKGYRNLTDSEFLAEFLATIDRSQFKMTWIHTGGMDPGKDDDGNGDKQGSFAYRPDINVFRNPIAIVPIYYNSYQDYDMIINNHSAKPQTSEANASSDGQLIGGNSISGVYNGYVIFNLQVSDGRKSGRNYKVKQNGKAEVTLPWDFDRSAVESYLDSL